MASATKLTQMDAVSLGELLMTLNASVSGKNRERLSVPVTFGAVDSASARILNNFSIFW